MRGYVWGEQTARLCNVCFDAPAQATTSCHNPCANRIWITPVYRRYSPNTAITIIIASAPYVRDQTNFRRRPELAIYHLLGEVAPVRNMPHISPGLERKHKKTGITGLPGALRLVT